MTVTVFEYLILVSIMSSCLIYMYYFKSLSFVCISITHELGLFTLGFVKGTLLEGRVNFFFRVGGGGKETHLMNQQVNQTLLW